MTEVIEHQTAVDLIEALINPKDFTKYYSRECPRPVYRGQGNAKWPLTPSGWRNISPNGLTRRAQETDPVTFHDLIENEKSRMQGIAKSFLEKGVSAPLGDLHGWLGDLGDPCLNTTTTGGHIEDRYIKLLAFAQLHGIDTRLLDWTLNPVIAAYFSAIQCMELASEDGQGSDDQHLAVFSYPHYIWSDVEDDTRLLAVEPHEHYFTPRVMAQRSILLYLPLSNFEENKTILSQQDTAFDSIRPDLGITKHILSSSHAGLLLRFCHRMGVSNSTMFPDTGWIGHLKDYKEERLINRFCWSHDHPTQ